MAIWLMRRLQRLLCEQFTLFPTEIATDAGRVGAPTTERRDNVLRTRKRALALNYGGSID
jgi:hypothetical protein